MQKRNAIGRKTRNDLEKLKSADALRGFYLAGGTGLAFLFNHRKSRDLDFFSKTAFHERRLIEALRRAGKFLLEKREPGTVRGRFRETLVSFFYYPYPLLRRPVRIAGIRVASPIDIACMKLDAISSRGTKRDFFDLYIIIQRLHVTLTELLRLFSKKYASVHYNCMHIKKSLVYFADAENDPDPLMTAPLSWDEVKRFFIREVRKI